MQGNHVSSLFVSNQSILSSFSSHFLPSRANDFSQEPVLKNLSTSDLEPKGHVLIVDDVADVTDMLSVLLTYAGYEVVTADSAAAAIAAAQEHRFDLIISDIGMPRMNGYDLAKALRKLPEYETVPMVAITGFSMFDDRARSLDAGFNAHLTKPIEPRALLDLIERL